MPQVASELGMLNRAKRQYEPQSPYQGVREWDVSYYMGMLKAREYDVNARMLGSYFSLNNCLDGVRVIVRALFDLDVTEEPVPAAESWAPGVRKLVFRDASAPDRAVVGHVYLDLFGRPNKMPSAATFAICSGGRDFGTREYVTPIVALVCWCEPSLGADVAGVGAVPVQMWWRQAQSRSCRDGRR